MTTADAAASTPPIRRRWSLQARLMATITAIVALILIISALTTSAIIGQVLDANLNSELTNSVNKLRFYDGASATATPTATEVLSNSPGYAGALLVIASRDGSLTGAYLDSDQNVVALSSDQLSQVAAEEFTTTFKDVSIDGLGDYRLRAPAAGGPGDVASISGISLTEMRSTIAQILTTVALVTLGGLLILAAAIIIVVRTSLKPLRSVAATATRVAALPLSEGEVSISERVPAAEADDRTEIGRVGAALNTLLDHVDTSLDARQRNEDRMRQFVADASHELRTPLASIRGYSELSLRALRTKSASTAVESTEASLERIQAQSLRMTTLVEDLLLLARLDEGQELVYGTVDLTRLVVEAVGDARPAGLEHRWSLDVGDDPIAVLGDETRLHQVIANLLANARTHTPSGTEVTVSLVREGADAVVRVHDDGPGIDPAVAAELFQRFARADRSRARNTGGTGLGLSIARAIVDAHHGSISVDSRPGDTTFIVRLPVSAS